MKKRIITISREFGSGGHSIGKIVAETLGIGFYDQELLEKIAEETGFIKNLAEKESCIIVGRCSDYILRDSSDCLHIFIYSDIEDREKRILERYGDSEKPIQKRITDKDTRRKIYYSHYTDRPWGIPQNYDLCLNSGALGEELCANSIINVFN